MELNEILKVAGVDSDSIVNRVYNIVKTDTKEDNIDIINEIEESFLLTDNAISDIISAEQMGTIDLKNIFDLDVMYLEDIDENNDVSVVLHSTHYDEPYDDVCLKFKFTSNFSSNIRTKINYHFETESMNKVITYIEDNEVPMFNKVASVYKATTKNGKPFEFCYMQVQGLFIEFNYIEIEFNSIEEYQGFNFDEYFHFINKKDVKNMSNNNAFRMEKLYKLFGTK